MAHFQTRFSRFYHAMRTGFFYFIVVIFLFYSFINASVVIVAKCATGVVIGADAMISQSAYISIRQNQKVYELNDGNIHLCCVSGEKEFHMIRYELENLCRRYKFDVPGSDADDSSNELSIQALTHYTRKLIKEKYRKAHMIVVGRDHVMKDFRIYELFPQGALLEHSEFTVSGSGSEYILSLMNEFYEEERDVPEDRKTAKALNVSLDSLKKRVANALLQATKLDNRSKGTPRITIIS
jgi:20S proteasome alpha/beta subunit